MEKNTAANAEDMRCGSIPGLERSPGGQHGNPLQDSCLENPMNRGDWRATVHRGHKEMDMTEQLEQGITTHSSILAGRILRDRGAW